MGLKPTASQKDIHRFFEAKKQAIQNSLINMLKYVGELCVNQARSLNTYRDQTGNLRNSVGYVLVYNGQIIYSNFQRSSSGNGTDTSTLDGKLVGEDLAIKLAGEYLDGWVLIVVAGMNYAASVESKGLDVLTSAEQLAERIVPQMIQNLKEDIAKSR